MNDDITIAVKVLAVLGGASLLIWIGIILVKAAKRGGGGIKGLGAALMMFGLGFIPNPRNETVAEATDGRIRQGDHSGDPLEPEGKS